MIITVIVLAISAMAAAGALVRFWNNIADFMLGKLLPGCRKYVPAAEPFMRAVFRKIDAVMVPVVRTIREKWGKLKTWLVGQLVFYERKSTNVYVQRIVSYFKRVLDSGVTKRYEHVETKEIDPIEIPDEFREEVVGLEASKINSSAHVEQAINHLTA